MPHFDYEHEHRFTEHEYDVLLHARKLAISEAEELTQPQSKTADRGRRLHRLILALRRARAQHRGARARNRLSRRTVSLDDHVVFNDRPHHMVFIRMRIPLESVGEIAIFIALQEEMKTVFSYDHATRS